MRYTFISRSLQCISVGLCWQYLARIQMRAIELEMVQPREVVMEPVQQTLDEELVGFCCLIISIVIMTLTAFL